ncbi:alpha/beta fold hydrolase [Ralstonia mojiangensis]|uniref:alpha/beta fold hydrolase n=1 Tax=Ralstonia mojiangensis TaxID=2953895 RepID=UPI0021B21F77|nr:alpha/beta hydrolase [Ralstonia mojiangensis]MCT7328463.1 alpha/beta hydrolase [Ralstonia mojiangensis]
MNAPARTVDLVVDAYAPSAVRHRTVDVEGVRVFYREAGPADAPTVLLLHGFPSASHMFRNLIPQLAERYHVVAPDFPGFGLTQVPSGFRYTFDNLARVVDGFTQAIGLSRYAIYVFDYGAPVGWRLAMAHPERISAIVTQNGNGYEEGLGEGPWAPVKAYWDNPDEAHRRALHALVSDEMTQWQYLDGVPDPTRVAPDGYLLDQYFLSRPGQLDIQMDLFLDYASNVALYPALHTYFRAHRPPLLAVWGRNDTIFIPPGAEAFKRDLPDAEIHFVDSGHFALETHHAEIGARMLDFLGRVVK